jgi:hypothetical protein
MSCLKRKGMFCSWLHFVLFRKKRSKLDHPAIKASGRFYSQTNSLRCSLYNLWLIVILSFYLLNEFFTFDHYKKRCKCQNFFWKELQNIVNPLSKYAPAHVKLPIFQSNLSRSAKKRNAKVRKGMLKLGKGC